MELKITNTTELNEEKQIQFYQFVLSNKFNSKFFLVTFILFIIGALTSFVFAISSLATTSVDFSSLKGVRILLIAILGLPVAALVGATIPFTSYRESLYKIAFTLIFIDLFVIFLPDSFEDLTIFNWGLLIAFLLFTHQMWTLTKTIARKNFATRGIVNYQYLITAEKIDLKITEQEKVLDQDGEVKYNLIVKDVSVHLSNIKQVFFHKKNTFVLINDNTFIFFDNSNFSIPLEEVKTFFRQKVKCKQL